MDIFDIYKLKFTIDSEGYPKAESESIQELGCALMEFKDSISNILRNTIEYNKIVSINPRANYKKGIVSDEDYYAYWGQLNDIEYYGCNEIALHLYDDKAELSFIGEPFCQIPIMEMIAIFKEWQMFIGKIDKMKV